MQKITSTSNILIKQMKALQEGKDELILIEGEKLIGEALKNNCKLIKLFIDEKSAEKYSKKYEINDENLYFVSSHVLKALSSTTTPQGIIAAVLAPKNALKSPQTNFLILDTIQDPGNLGTIIRSAIGAGFNTIYAINCVNYLSPKVIRSSMGAVFSIDIYNVTYEQIKQKINTKNIQLICADMSGENIFKFKPAEGIFGIVMGSEGRGVSNKIREFCTHTVKIPMSEKLESLNVSIAASLFMYILTNK